MFAELAQMEEQCHHLTFRSEQSWRETTVKGIHLSGVSPYIIAEGMEGGDDMLGLWVVAGFEELCIN